MKSAARTAAMAVIPLVAMVTLAAGLRIGASDATRAAIVRGAPPAHGTSVLAWQIEALREDGRVREALADTDLLVTARAGAARAEWRGTSNAEGIAEARLALDAGPPPREVWVEVRAGQELLASASATVPAPWHDLTHPAAARATRKEGSIVLEVMPLGGRLAVGFPGALWVRATDRTGRPLSGVAIDAEPEPGLDVPSRNAVTCASGWAQFVVTPTFHVTGLSLHAQTDGKDGLWYGAVPVAGGASHVAAPLRIAAGAPRGVDITAASGKGPIYAEIDDGEGRAFASVLAGSPALLEVPSLADGLYWIVTSSRPRGAEAIDEGTLARPLLVAREAVDACELGAKLVATTPTGFPRAIVVDGFAGRREAAQARRRLGTAIGLSALAIAALLEGLMLVGAARRGRARIDARYAKASPAGSLAVALLAALLGFALLAALVLYRAN